MISNYPDNFTDADAIKLGIKEEKPEEKPEEELDEEDRCPDCGQLPCDGGSYYCKMD